MNFVSILNLFENQCKRQPDRTALIDECDELTYGELNKRADSLASVLHGVGVKHGSVVGIYMGRSKEYVVAIIATLKCGATYLPLDASAPTERIKYMIADSDAMVLLCDSLTNEDYGVPIVECNKIDVDIAQEHNSVLPAPQFSENDLAYVIYTSGTTGMPKGVMITHSNVMGLMNASQDVFSFTPEETWLLTHSFAFDFSVWEMWGALTTGACLVVASDGARRGATEFVSLISHYKITVLNVTPTAFRLLVQGLRGLTSIPVIPLKTVIFGGERIDLSSIKQWFEWYGSDCPRLYNMYGITETTVHVTYYHLTLPDCTPRHGTPIGIELPGWACHLLCENGNFCKPREVGEIFVSGVGVAKGYMFNDLLSDVRFVERVDIDGYVKRMYKTGDLGYRDTDGKLYYIGRCDRQVKVRGHRIELGEVENVIKSQSAILECVVSAQAVAGEEQLIAYVVMEPNIILDQEKIREASHRYLPPYMVPTRVVQISHIPETANGKLDLEVLTAFEETSQSRPIPTMESSQIEAQDLERELLRAMADLLGHSRLQSGDDFFVAGAHSLMVMRLLARIHQEHGVLMTASEIYENPSAKQLAQAVREKSSIDISHFFEMEAPKVGETFEFTPAQMAIWLANETEGNSDTYHIGEVRKINGDLQIDILLKSIRGVLDRHPMLLSQIVTTEPLPRLQYSATYEQIVQIKDLRGYQDLPERMDDLMNGLLRAPFVATTSPLCRIMVIQLGDQKTLILLVAHHLIFDAWSSLVVWRDLWAMYSAMLLQTPYRAPKELGFHQYAAHENAEMEHRRLSASNYWKRTLIAFEDVARVLREKPSVKRGAVVSTVHILDEGFKEDMDTACTKQRCGVFPFILSAWLVLLHRYSGIENLTVSCPLANRKMPFAEETVGFLVRIVPILVSITRDTKFEEIIQATQLQLIQGLDNACLPVQEIWRHCNMQPEMFSNPLLNLTVIYHPKLQDSQIPPGLEIESGILGSVTAKSDLSLVIKDTDRMSLAIEYDSNNFFKGSMELLLERLQMLLVQVVNDPSLSMDQIDLFLSGEREKIIKDLRRIGPDRRSHYED